MELLDVFVIKMPERSIADLIEQVENLDFPTNIHIIEATTPETLNCQGSQTRCRELHGKLTCVEFCVALSHIRARQFAYKIGAKVSLFLEDDAALDYTRSIIAISAFDLLPKTRPFGLHLFPEQFGIIFFNRRKTKKKIL